ncbi:Ribokinase-like protein [Fomitopsis serialis]|uniref:Ribokinase-like protein n=1 Tax=Fomitopsis serialis TaxID=139415 RepID=UPI00200798C1|nr:Ribokinase-like protein [Neoantrodia serialis]KAH9938441.1 Ribokinase-like protein [Neoantrodia serialis]
MAAQDHARVFVSLGMFIIDEFQFHDEEDIPTGRTLPAQIGGGGTYAALGARIWLPPDKVGMIIDRGTDFPEHIQQKLDVYDSDMWLFRDHKDRVTTRSLNSYKGEHRGFQYTTPRLRLTPRNLQETKLRRPEMLHFICSPTRAAAIISEVKESSDWNPVTIYEPIPDRCVPEELQPLIGVLPSISVLSPNAEEAMSLLSIPGPPTKPLVEEACRRFLEHGVGPEGNGAVIIRSGALGAYVATRKGGGEWIPAFWSETEAPERVVDVTGAGNSFLGGLGSGLALAGGNIVDAALYGTVSASFTIEQEGLPHLTETRVEDGVTIEQWNGDSPHRRLRELQERLRRQRGT